jgi:DNA invertase Pin-like site-specific DNA recombinase
MTSNRGARQKGEIEFERNELLAKTLAEIDSLVTQHEARLPRERATAVGGIYARYSSRYQDSIVDQVRAMLEEAERRSIHVPRENIFFDMATRGYKARRRGLQELQAALAAGKLSVLFVFSTNRLFRKAHKSMAFVEEEVVERGKRCIFVSNGIDTADGDRWRTWLQFNAMMDEMGAGMYASNVRAGQQGLFERGMVCGALPVGYTGEDVPGELTKRKKPRQKVVVEPTEATYVQRVFTWFVESGVAISEIARRLNDDRDSPSPSRSQTGRWSHRTVRALLSNGCYRGCWTYGKTETKWQSKKDYSRQVPRSQPLATRQFEDRRIVSDSLWHAAQARLAKNRRAAGRKSKDGVRARRPRLLNGFFWCPQHDRALEVSGGFGHAMICRDCRATDAATRPLYSYLDRQLALHVICRRMADLLRADEDLIQGIITACQTQAEQLQQADPARLQKLRAQETKVARRIEFAFHHLGETEEDLTLSEKIVRDLRTQRSELLAEISQLEAAAARPSRVPTHAEVRTLVQDLQLVFEEIATDAADADELGRIREVFQLLTGGRIELFQQGERRKHGGWLQGRFRCNLLGYAVWQLTGVIPDSDGVGCMVVVDFQAPVTENPDLQRAWELYACGHLNNEIARSLGCSKSKVTTLLRTAAHQRGVPLEDGHARRGRLKQVQEGPPLFQRISDDVKRLADAGELFHTIASQLQCSVALITKAWQFWHTSRGLEAPDGRTRRKSLTRKQAA